MDDMQSELQSCLDMNGALLAGRRQLIERIQDMEKRQADYATLRTWVEKQLAMCNEMVAFSMRRNDTAMMADHWHGSVNAFKILLDYVECVEKENEVKNDLSNS